MNGPAPHPSLNRTPVRTMTGVVHSEALLTLLTVLAIARLTRLVTNDAITQPARAWIIRHRPTPATGPDAREDWLVYLIHCRWCASIWLAFPVSAAVYNWPTSWPVQIGLIALTGSTAAGLLARLED